MGKFIVGLLRILPLYALLLALPAIAAAQTPQYYGAIAYDITKRVFVADKGATPADTLAAAEQTCRNQGGGDSCQALRWFTNSWASLALSPADRTLPHGEPEGAWGSASGADQADTDERALAGCNRNTTGGGCQLVLRVGIGGSARDSETARPLHGGDVVNSFIEGEQDHDCEQHSPQLCRDWWGVDFDTNDTDPAVYPARAGQVAFAGWDCRATGRQPQPTDVPYTDVPCNGYTVVVDHGNGLSSLYALMRKDGLPQVGQAVTPMTRIGTMSDSGCPSSEPQRSWCGPRLRYSMRRGSLTPPNGPIDGPTEAIRTPWRRGPMAREPKGTASNLIVLVHGCCTDANDVIKDMDSFGRLIARSIHPLEEWEIVVRDWSDYTPKPMIPLTLDPVQFGIEYAINFKKVADQAYDAVSDQPGQPPGQGSKIKNAIAAAMNQSSVNAYEHIHFIGHSAGAKLIQEAAQKLAADKNNLKKKPFIHLTFLDAYTRDKKDSGEAVENGIYKGYGYLEDYPDHYAEHYVDIGLAATDACLSSAFNFNISNWLHFPTDGGLGGHQWPVHWYQQSVTSSTLKYYGFPLSLEGGNGLINGMAAVYIPGKQCALFNEDTDCKPEEYCGMKEKQ